MQDIRAVNIQSENHVAQPKKNSFIPIWLDVTRHNVASEICDSRVDFLDMWLVIQFSPLHHFSD